MVDYCRDRSSSGACRNMGNDDGKGSVKTEVSAGGSHTAGIVQSDMTEKRCGGVAIWENTAGSDISDVIHHTDDEETLENSDSI